MYKYAYSDEAKIMSLLDYLKQVSIPKDVEELAKKGHERYKLSPLKERLKKLKPDQAPGARSRGWIFDTFGLKEAEILKKLQDLPAPLTWSVGDIDVAYQNIVKDLKKKRLEKVQFVIVNGVGVSGLHRTELGKSSIIQLASQFNYLESASADITNVSDYIFDWTQGPLGAVEAAAAALHRHAAVTSLKLPHALHNVLPQNAEKIQQEREDQYYKNGYLMLRNLSDETKNLLLKNISENIEKLEILAQWVICESSGASQLQVFSAAPSFQGVETPNPDSIESAICRKLVISQYEAIAKLAVMQSILLGREIRLHLTLVGQGAFNNPSCIIKEVLNCVSNIVKGQFVTVFIHVFGDTAKEKILQAKDDSFIFEEMSRETFMQASESLNAENSCSDYESVDLL